MFKEHDVVALTEDRAADQLHAGDVGAIVHCHAKGAAFEVEFVDERGKHKRVATIPAGQLMRLNLLSLTA